MSERDNTRHAGKAAREAAASGPVRRHPLVTDKGRVLLVDDSRTIQAVIGQALRDRGFVPAFASDGAEALRAIREDQPDAVILDINLPDIDGYEICKITKADPTTYKIPIMVLTSLEQPGFEVMAIDAGADDFVTKPVDPLVLDARLRMLIQRNRRERYSNPLTGLPGNILIDQELSVRLSRSKPFCLAYVDLDYFKCYNDKYGYQRGDDVLLMTAGLIQEAVREVGSPEDFVGHIGGDDFVIMTGVPTMRPVAERIISQFDATILDHYDERTRERRSFDAIDRRGNILTVPVMSISIASVDNQCREFDSSVEMVDVVTELKRHAKAQDGSSYVFDRRHRERHDVA